MDKDNNELYEACDLIDQLLGMSCLEDMIKDLKLSKSPKDDELLGYYIYLHGRAKDFMEKHAKKKDPDEVVIEAVSDLWARDVEELLNSGKEKEARAVMKAMGLSKEEVEKTINERKGVSA